MSDNGLPSVIPFLSYEDVGGSADWLVRAFGFEEVERLSEGDGRVAHSTLRLNGGVVMLGNPGADYQSPKRHADVCEHARRWLTVPYVVDGVLVYVDDLDAHCERARSAGATILSEPEDTPHGRHYRAADVEGHRWMFSAR